MAQQVLVNCPVNHTMKLFIVFLTGIILLILSLQFNLQCQSHPPLLSHTHCLHTTVYVYFCVNNSQLSHVREFGFT